MKPFERAPEPKTLHRSAFCHSWQAGPLTVRIVVDISGRLKYRAIALARQLGSVTAHYDRSVDFSDGPEFQFIMSNEAYAAVSKIVKTA